MSPDVAGTCSRCRFSCPLVDSAGGISPPTEFVACSDSDFKVIEMRIIAQVLHIEPVMQRRVLALCEFQDVANMARKSE
jgi:hypothetical protein